MNALPCQVFFSKIVVFIQVQAKRNTILSKLRYTLLARKSMNHFALKSNI